MRFKCRSNKSNHVSKKKKVTHIENKIGASVDNLTFLYFCLWSVLFFLLRTKNIFIQSPFCCVQ